ncbi:MAG: HAD hydrolase-like protein, partial [Pseudomonadota bacterium]|nr:HAD hydrolase-like protein [Pseudomonadota bacterium]
MQELKKYKAVIFDWDGTLMNSEARIVDAIQIAAKETGLPVLPYDESKQIIGLSLEKAILGLYPELEQSHVVAMSEAYTQCFLEESTVDMVPFDGAEALLLNLKQ